MFQSPLHIITLFLFLAAAVPSTCIFAQSKIEKQAEKAYESRNMDEAGKLWLKALREYNDNADYQNEVRMLMQLGKLQMHSFKIDSALYYYREAGQTALDNGDKVNYGKALNSLSSIYAYKGMQDSVLSVLDEVMNIEGMPHDYISDAHSTLANVYESRFDYERAEKELLEAIRIDTLHRDSSSLPFNLVHYARLLSRETKNDEAVFYLFKAIDNLRGEKDKFKYATIYYELAAIFFRMNNGLKSREYAQKSIEICDELGLRTTRVEALIILANNEERDGEYFKALAHYSEAEEISKSKKRVLSLINCQLGKAACYIRLDSLQLAGNYLDSAEAQLKQVENELLDTKFQFLKSIYDLKIRGPRALPTALRTFENIRSKNNIYFTKYLSLVLANTFAQSKNYKDAWMYYLQYDELSDSIYRIQQSYITQDLEARYRKKEQETQIKLLGAENEFKSIRLQQQSYMIMGSILAIVIFAGLLLALIRYYNRSKQQKELAEKSLHEKNVLLREIHHRVKNNLQVISSLLALQSKYIEDDNALVALQQGQDRVHSMALIHEDLYRSENLTGVDTEIYFDQLVDNLFESYNIHEDRIEMKMDVEAISLDVDTMIPLGLILNELVSNALKHAFSDDQKGLIQVSLHEEANHLRLEVRDNGNRIKSKDEIEGKSFGFELIKAFARKLKADINISVDKGLCIQLLIRQYNKAA